MEIKDKLKQRRIELSLTMADVANAVGVSEATVSRWESGNISDMKRNRIVALAKVLQISPSVIMGWDEEYPISSPSKVTNYHLTPDEIKLISVYRNNPDIRAKIQAFLEVSGEPLTPPTRTIKVAAYGGGVIDHKITATDQDIKEALEESADDQYIMKKKD